MSEREKQPTQKFREVIEEAHNIVEENKNNNRVGTQYLARYKITGKYAQFIPEDLRLKPERDVDQEETQKVLTHDRIEDLQSTRKTGLVDSAKRADDILIDLERSFVGQRLPLAIKGIELIERARELIFGQPKIRKEGRRMLGEDE